MYRRGLRLLSCSASACSFFEVVGRPMRPGQCVDLVTRGKMLPSCFCLTLRTGCSFDEARGARSFDAVLNASFDGALVASFDAALAASFDGALAASFEGALETSFATLASAATSSSSSRIKNAIAQSIDDGDRGAASASAFPEAGSEAGGSSVDMAAGAGAAGSGSAAAGAAAFGSAFAAPRRSAGTSSFLLMPAALPSISIQACSPLCSICNQDHPPTTTSLPFTMSPRA
mmetsp:Transcript_93044/g.161737  ORF Transcript_93044/g.161737 Transcript_93044/m.161737 type:complete len:231 (+) Transcript_93044:862-1554(+)